MDLSSMINTFNKHFVYTKDGKLDAWISHDFDIYAPTTIKGDCDDYSFTLKSILEEHTDYSCKVMKGLFKGAGHMILEVDTKEYLDVVYIDNIYKQFLTKEKLENLGYSNFKYPNAFEVFSKYYIVGWIIKYYLKSVNKIKEKYCQKQK